MQPFHAQNIDSYQWKNRILLVLTDDIDNSIFKNQIEELKRYEDGLKERKLIVYQIHNKAYKLGLAENSNWQQSTQKYKTQKKTKSAFEVLLIGLDGGVKLRKTDLISCEALFRIIDVMPMRKNELNNN
jgi:hypothetical protein